MRLALDERLIRSAKRGGEALDHLIGGVWPEAYRIARGVLHDAGLAEDAAQDACAAVVRGLPALKDDQYFGTWFYKIAVNCAIAISRRQPQTQPLGTLDDTVAHVDRSEAMDLQDALARLSPAQRGAVLLHYYADLNSSEIAAATGLPASTVRFHLMAARKKLREALSVSDTRTAQSAEGVASNVR